MAKNEIVKLIGITSKGKNRIREHGEFWTVIDIKDNGDMLFEANDGYLKWGVLPDFKIV